MVVSRFIVVVPRAEFFCVCELCACMSIDLVHIGFWHLSKIMRVSV